MAARRKRRRSFAVWRWGAGGRRCFAVAFALLAALAWGGGAYWQTLAADALILMIFGISLQSMMALGGFGQLWPCGVFCAWGLWRGLRRRTLWGASLLRGGAGRRLRFTALAVAAVFGAAVVRSSGCTWRCCRWRWLGDLGQRRSGWT